MAAGNHAGRPGCAAGAMSWAGERQRPAACAPGQSGKKRLAPAAGPIWRVLGHIRRRSDELVRQVPGRSSGRRGKQA